MAGANSPLRLVCDKNTAEQCPVKAYVEYSQLPLGLPCVQGRPPSGPPDAEKVLHLKNGKVDKLKEGRCCKSVEQRLDHKTCRTANTKWQLGLYRNTIEQDCDTYNPQTLSLNAASNALSAEHTDKHSAAQTLGMTTITKPRSFQWHTTIAVHAYFDE